VQAGDEEIGGSGSAACNPSLYTAALNSWMLENQLAMQRYSEMFQGPLDPKAIAALRATTYLANGHLTEAAAALATEELAAQVDAAAA
jgi:hypothetical protein